MFPIWPFDFSPYYLNPPWPKELYRIIYDKSQAQLSAATFAHFDSIDGQEEDEIQQKEIVENHLMWREGQPPSPLLSASFSRRLPLGREQ
jgi:hypothetical protein